MRRRHALAAIAGAPQVLRAQPARPRIGLRHLGSASHAGSPHLGVMWRLEAPGWVDGRSVTLVPRFADGPRERQPAPAAGPAQQKADVILAIANIPPFAEDALAVHDPEFVLAQRLPVVVEFRELAYAGALLSCGATFAEFDEVAARQIDRILRGASKPAAMPIERPTRFEPVRNPKVSAALGLALPRELLLRADEVIE